MSKLKKLVFVFMVLLGSTFVACQDDDDDITTLNMGMEVAGTAYSLSHGVISVYGGDSINGYENDIILFSSGITISIANNELDTVYGTGSSMYLSCITNSETEISSGAYVLDSNNGPLSLDDVIYMTSYDFGNGSGTNDVELDSGTLTVSRVGTNYLLEFVGVDEHGSIIKLHYQGALTSMNGTK